MSTLNSYNIKLKSIETKENTLTLSKDVFWSIFMNELGTPTLMKSEDNYKTFLLFSLPF